MKKKLKILFIICEIVAIFFIVNWFWQFLSQKGDLNMPISLLSFSIIGLFWVPLLFKQIKNIW